MDFAINNDSSTKNPFDGEIGVFKKFRLEAKNTLFGILFIALKGQETSIYTFAILICIQLLQLLIFPFHPSVSIWFSLNNILGISNLGYIQGVRWLRKASSRSCPSFSLNLQLLEYHQLYGWHQLESLYRYPLHPPLGPWHIYDEYCLHWIQHLQKKILFCLGSPHLQIF